MTRQFSFPLPLGWLEYQGILSVRELCVAKLYQSFLGPELETPSTKVKLTFLLRSRSICRCFASSVSLKVARLIPLVRHNVKAVKKSVLYRRFGAKYFFKVPITGTEISTDELLIVTRSSTFHFYIRPNKSNQRVEVFRQQLSWKQQLHTEWKQQRTSCWWNRSSTDSLERCQWIQTCTKFDKQASNWNIVYIPCFRVKQIIYIINSQKSWKL